MSYKENRHIYMAGPFFNDTQRDLCTFIEGLGTEDSPIYSPRLDGGVLKPNATNQERDEIFRSNVEAIVGAEFVLAIVDDFDAGTMWEMGCAYAMGIPTLGYSDIPGRGLNVMLAGSCKLGFINGRPELSELFTSKADRGSWKFPRNTWGGEIQ